MLIPGYALHLILRGQFELVSWETLVFIGLVGGFVLACVISRSRFKRLEFVGIMGFSGAYVGGAVLFFNCMFDPNPVETVTQRNRDPRYGPGVFIVNLKDARTHGVSQLFLKSFHFRDTSEGICVRVHRGSLFLSWYTVDPYRDCPGATAALAALQLRYEQLCAAGNAQACAAIAQDKTRRQARNFRPENTPEMRCFNGDNVQCQRLCDRGKKYLSCANQDWLIMDPAWTVKAWTQGANADGRYVANVMVSCKTPLETLAPSPSSPAQNTVEFDGVQFRGPSSKRLYNTMAEALSEVCVTARALQPGGQVSGCQATRPDSRDRYIKVPHRAERPSVHKCKSPDGKLIFTDTACPE